MKTLLLDIAAWDLVLDSAGNIAVAADPYSQAQDVASAIRLFSGELFYNTSKGVPYFADVLGESPPASYFVRLMTNAAMSVPDVARADCVIESEQNRTLSGSVVFQTAAGVQGVITI